MWSLINNKFEDIIPKPRLRSSKWLSTSVPECRWHTDHAKLCDAYYLANNIVSLVFFHSTLEHIPKYAIVIEISPNSMFKSIVNENLGPYVNFIGLMKRNNNGGNVDMILSAIGRLYQMGHNPDISKLYPRLSIRSVAALNRLVHSFNGIIRTNGLSLNILIISNRIILE